MDEDLTGRARAGARVAAVRVLAVAVLAAAGCHAAAGAAAGLQDPTRPPAALAALTAAPGASGAPASAGPRLQTILIGRQPGGRLLAVIDGEAVRVGDAVQGARVVRIADNEVVLARGAERQVLRLYAQEEGGRVTPAEAARGAARE